MLDFDCELKAKLDFAKPGLPKVAALLALEILLIDEVSMIDVDCWSAATTVFADVAHAVRPGVPAADAFGEVNVILFGDSITMTKINCKL